MQALAEVCLDVDDAQEQLRRLKLLIDYALMYGEDVLDEAHDLVLFFPGKMVGLAKVVGDMRLQYEEGTSLRSLLDAIAISEDVAKEGPTRFVDIGELLEWLGDDVTPEDLPAIFGLDEEK